MSERIVDNKVVKTPPKVTVGFTRKLSAPYPQYESAEASAFVEAVLDSTDPSGDEVIAAAAAAFSIAKAQVFDELGIDYDVDPVTNRVVENLRAEVGAQVVEDKPAAKPARTAPKSVSPPSEDEKDAAWKQLQEELAAPKVTVETKNGDVSAFPSFWDNRETKKGRQPDFKVRNTRVATQAGLKPDTALWLESAPDWFDETVEVY